MNYNYYQYNQYNYNQSYRNYGETGERGLVNQNNSCYCDVTIFSMFARTSIFDQLFLYNFVDKSKREKKDNVVDTREILNAFCNITTLLRTRKHCPSNLVQQFRDSLCVVNSRMKSEMLDVEEFITTFFGRALNLPHFIRYSVGTGAYLHQLFISNISGGEGSKLMDVQNAFKQSMENQGLSLAAVPTPALFVKIPRGRDEVNRRSPVIPNIILDVSSSMTEDGNEGHTCTKLELLAVICLCNYHYTTFVREKKDVWCYFDSLSGVKDVYDIEEELSCLEKDSKYFKRISYHTQIMVTTIHMCIYKPLDEESESEVGATSFPSLPSSSKRNKNKKNRAKGSRPYPYEKKPTNFQAMNNRNFNQSNSTESFSAEVEYSVAAVSQAVEKMKTMEEAQIPQNSSETFNPVPFEELEENISENPVAPAVVDEEAGPAETETGNLLSLTNIYKCVPTKLFSYAVPFRNTVRVLYNGAMEQCKVERETLLSDSEMDVEETQVPCDSPSSSEAHESYSSYSTLV